MPLLKEWDGSKWSGVPSIDFGEKLFDISQPPAMLSGIEQIRADLIKAMSISNLSDFVNAPLGLPYYDPKKDNK